MEHDVDTVETNDVSNEIIELEEVVSFITGSISGEYGSGGWKVGGVISASC